MSQAIDIVFITHDGKEIPASGEEGMSVLQLAFEMGIDIEGACEGNMACSTCHVIVDKSFYNSLPAPSEEEEDMLDLATGLTPTSRLGCQIALEPSMQGMRLNLPKESRNMMGL